MNSINTSLHIGILMVLMSLFALSGLYAQAPQKMTFQTVIRNSSNELVKETQVGLRISILQGTADGTVVYSETQTPVTNVNGLVSMEIGGGAGFDTIDWVKGPYFMKTEVAIDATMSEYTHTGTSQILSVPYAIAVNTAVTFDKLTPRGTLVCDESTEGAMRYNPHNHLVEFCNGSIWVPLDSGVIINIPTVNTLPAISITVNSAKTGGSITENGGAEIIQKGICWGTEGNLTLSSNTTLNGTGSDSFVSGLTGLVENTLYHSRAYATNTAGTGYGEEQEFTTLASLTTSQVSGNTSNSFVSGGDIQTGGGAFIIERGIAYGAGISFPDINDSKLEMGTGTGVFSDTISGLAASTSYYLRAYATNAGGTTYGNRRNTTTLAEVVSADQSLATTTSITAGGEVFPGGGIAISAKGIVYGTAENPVISGTKTSNGSGAGVFTSVATGLASNSLYNYRAYATNISGTGYGNNKTATTLASITTRVARERTDSSLITGGDIVIGGGQTITERGVVYGTIINPTILDNKVIASENGTGGFSVTLSGLSNKTNNYYYRAYAVNAGGVSYGNECSSFTDSRDGTSYETVWIGSKEWMAQNLAYLPSVVGSGTGSQTTPHYYVYGYNGTVVADAKASPNYLSYGVLYNWPAAMNGQASSTANPSGVQGACPAGWHLPSDAEWKELTDRLGGESVAAGKLKETGTSHWITQYTGVTNETGFTALPGGIRFNFDVSFSNAGIIGHWWSATEKVSSDAWSRVMSVYHSGVSRYSESKDNAYSIRCIRDN